MQSGYDINHLYREAHIRWLKPVEVFFILQNYEENQLTHQTLQKPASGSLYLFNKRVVKSFRKDGHSWRKRKDQSTIAEAHERLKVGNVEALNCYYARGEEYPKFQRRSYWILDPEYEHIVLVHYRDTGEGRQNARSTSQFLPLSSSTFTPSPNSFATHQPDLSFVIGESYELNHNQSSPSSVGISSSEIIRNQGINHLDIREHTDEVNSSSVPESSQALHMNKQQLSLNDDESKEIITFYIEDSNNLEDVLRICDLSGQTSSDSDNLLLQQCSDDASRQHHQLPGVEVDIWKDMLDSSKSLPDVESLAQLGGLDAQKSSMMIPQAVESLNYLAHSPVLNAYGMNSNCFSTLFDQDELGISLEDHLSFTIARQQKFTIQEISPKSSMMIPQAVESLNYLAHSPVPNAYGINSNCLSTLFDQDELGISFEDQLSQQKFTIREISPNWCHISEDAKIIIIGSFLCDPSEYAWACMFGDIEVPVQIIQEGVICCHAPPQLQGKVTLCITSGNRESCSEVREFEYRPEPSVCTHSNPPEAEDSKSPEELLLLVRFVQMLLSDLLPKDGVSESRVDLLDKYKTSEDRWSQVIDALSVGTSTSLSTLHWLLQELLKDKLGVWLSSKSHKNNQKGCSLSKKEQGIIHMASMLGFEWALQPILNSGISVNFRDFNGWTALHWAAYFGREKMVAALIASGASAGAITDPTSQDPTGKTPASIAATWGHRGLAGYLSEVALNSHVSSLKLEESELSKGSAALEAEKTVNSLLKVSSSTNEDHGSLNDTLAAVRNAAQAAARIQSAFRAHSFRNRQQKEAAVAIASASGDYYSILENDIQGLSAASKLAFGNARDYSSAALSIQKKYRGRKDRKDFLSIRQKVVKIQAHVRGYQVRKHYNVRWAVGILEKVVLRWRRRGVGLRGFRHDSESIDESEDEDILRVFRKQKVEAAIDEAVSRVLSMVECPTARQQYGRLLEKYRQAKAELQSVESDTSSSSHHGVLHKENEEVY